uniref:Toxin_TOLIP domain-containing protein n=1 Tax=Strongyloides papillosus TaxID=174720 RepID=A0A0N5CFR0_STREA
MRLYIIFSIFFVLISAIREQRHECFTCDDFCDCISPRVSLCPPETRCYSLRSKNGDIEHMGCALSCSSVNRADYEKCEECVGDLCALPNMKLNIDSEKCLNRKSISNKRDIGGGATFNNHQGIGNGAQPGHNGIGQGANPGQVGIGGGATLGNSGIGNGANPEQVGIGGGTTLGNSRIGHGANPGQMEIGRGLNFDRPYKDGFDRHSSVERDIGDGARPVYHRTPIGSGANPFDKNSAQRINVSNLLNVIFLTLTAVFFYSN